MPDYYPTGAAIDANYCKGLETLCRVHGVCVSDDDPFDICKTKGKTDMPVSPASPAQLRRQISLSNRRIRQRRASMKSSRFRQLANDAAALLAEFGIDSVALASIARRNPSVSAKGNLQIARSLAVHALKKLKPLLSATPGSIIVFNDLGDPPRIADRHCVVLEIEESGTRKWFVVSASANGWSTRRQIDDYELTNGGGRFLVFLEPLSDSDERQFSELVGLPVDRLILDEPKSAPSSEAMKPASSLSLSNRRPARGRMSDRQVATLLRSRGKDAELMPRTV